MWRLKQKQSAKEFAIQRANEVAGKANEPTNTNSTPPMMFKSIPTNKPTKTSKYSQQKTVQPDYFVPTEEYKKTVCEAAYLGKKGYTIPLTVLLPEDLEFLKVDLFLKPAQMGPQYGPPDETAAFPVYRENAKKIYLPRFYGIERYGPPTRSELTDGQPISVDFVKPLRDYQDKIIDVYMKHVKPMDQVGTSTTRDNIQGGAILEVPCGRGKCLAKNTPILMYNGSTKMVQDVKVGDQIMGDDKTPRNVLTLATGREIMYKVQDAISHEDPKKRSHYIVNKSHILSLKNMKTMKTVDMPLTDYLQMSSDLQEHFHGYRVPIDFDVDFYTESYKNTDPYIYGKMSTKYRTSIPEDRKCLSSEFRLHMLAGFVDMIGSSNDQGGYTITLEEDDTCPTLQYLQDILFIIRSLGLHIQVNKTDTHTDIYIASTTYCHVNEIPTRNVKSRNKYSSIPSLTYPIFVQEMPEDDYYGFEIDGNRRFVLGDFTVTHNTVMALKIISLLQKKTLIIVHKEFLMNQWIERAQEFVPSAKIGRIQGGVFDVEGKDVVLGMLQTLYDREFPEGAFDSFGLTIVDEVHRIGSEQFSKTLLRVITPYMLGISATVDRKDKMTRLIYMFMGPKIYTEKREDVDPVMVRAIEYISTDPEFNETAYDFRGQAKYSTMISKISEFGPRSDFIVRVLADLLQEQPEAQIMVLCHNRSLLTYFYEAIHHKGFATTGYYVGGMKQADLQATEGKQIVLATYAMAAEALDIKTLSILVMASPKTDITQSVGRILRVRHEHPIVVDIVDRHDIFQNQWKQRKTFYRKCNYRIRSIDSIRYAGMMVDWTVDKTWSRVFDPKGTGQGQGTGPGQGKGADQDEVECTGGNPLLKKKCLISLDDADLGLDEYM